MLTLHAIQRCRDRNINPALLDQKVISKDFIISLTQPDGCQICWTIVEDQKIHFIYANDRVITVLEDGVIPSYMNNIISDKGIRKKFFKRYSKEGHSMSLRKRDKIIKREHDLQIRESV